MRTPDWIGLNADATSASFCNSRLQDTNPCNDRSCTNIRLPANYRLDTAYLVSTASSHSQDHVQPLSPSTSNPHGSLHIQASNNPPPSHPSIPSNTHPEKRLGPPNKLLPRPLPIRPPRSPNRRLPPTSPRHRHPRPLRTPIHIRHGRHAARGFHRPDDFRAPVLHAQCGRNGFYAGC